MRRKFTDHFGAVADNYMAFRPRYPQALFTWLASLVPRHNLAWDCAAGSGQATVDLAAHFAHVVATDASRAQIESAAPHPRITYRVATAEDSGIETSSVDLIAVAQALHWFPLDAFYNEAIRVLTPEGVLAVWSYGVLKVEGAAVNALIQEFYHETIGPYWPPERAHVENGYRTLPFPFPEIVTPDFIMETEWALAELLGYLRSWSATARFVSARGVDPVSTLAQQLTTLWGGPDCRLRVSWPLALRVGRRPGSC